MHLENRDEFIEDFWVRKLLPVPRVHAVPYLTDRPLSRVSEPTKRVTPQRYRIYQSTYLQAAS